MNLRISGKNMSIGAQLHDRIEVRIKETVSKYFDGEYSGNVTVEKSGAGFECDCMIHLSTGMILHAQGNNSEAIGCFDEVAERIEKRLRRYKRRLKSHHNNSTPSKIIQDASYFIMGSPEKQEEVEENFSPVTIAESLKKINTQSVADAIVQLDLIDEPVVVFTNVANQQINVVYRRSDGNIGWIDPGRKSSN